MDEIIATDSWDFLKSFTSARIALGKSGQSVPTQPMLQFQLAHAQAKDAVYAPLDTNKLMARLQNLGLGAIELQSQASHRNEYLKRPDLGRKLSENSKKNLQKIAAESCQLAIVIADGLSATAIQHHALPFLEKFVPLCNDADWKIAPVALVAQGRVAVGDETAFLLGAKMVAVLIGERPGLSSPDSMGIYFTYEPAPGLTDESRNCISNIHANGLAYETAALKLFYLATRARELGLSGVGLKDEMLLK